jgi:predicted GH43/DUF377 family glycosyl hydrolase/glycosyltransferase involved in cell wall biosynthesis
LIAAVRAADPSTTCRIAAIEEPGVLRAYKSDVRWRIHQGDPDSYRAAARSINLSNADAVNVQHEFGLYGVWRAQVDKNGAPIDSAYEDYLSVFLQELRKPVVTTLHTVLPKPNASLRKTIRSISELSDELIVMAETAVTLLKSDYGIMVPPRVIPHGTPTIVPHGRATFKAKMGVKGRSLISTFGLVDPRKGLEFMIEAMPEIVAQHPDALYLIAGRSHPDLLRDQGEDYRNSLVALTKSLGINDHVAFIDQYMTQHDIIELLLATDVYVTPYLDPNQITSGTLSYALGAGKAIVSTRYLHAVEALDDGRGTLVDFRDSKQLARAVNAILGDPVIKQSMEQSTFAYAREATWPRVGKAFLAIATEMVDDYKARTLSQKGGERKRSSDLGRRVVNNPIITVADVKPSRPGMEVMSVTNAAAAQVDDEVVLVLRVSERPQPGIDPPDDALTLDLTMSDPRVQQLGEGYRSDDVVSFAYFDMASLPGRVVDVYLPRDLNGLDLSDPRRIRFHHPTGGFSAATDDFNDFLTQMSHLRVARSRDGLHFKVDDGPSVLPENHFDEYGCEDPRATFIDGAWHITYVSVGRIGITTSRLTTTDFSSFEHQGVMFLPDHKDVALFPEKVDGRYAALTRPMPQSFGRTVGIWIAFSDDLVSWGDHRPVARPRPGLWDELRIGAGCVPLRVSGGWLEIYHGVNRDSQYSLGGMLLDAHDPSQVLARSSEPILVPTDTYETSGVTKNHVFTCGHVGIDAHADAIRVYYGAAGSVIAAADFQVGDILDQLHPC